MNAALEVRPRELSALELTLRALQPTLGEPGVTEVCINSPGEAFVESAAGWQQVTLTFASFDWCLRLCKLIANATHQRIDEQSPLLSASLPGGERVQLAPLSTNRYATARTGAYVVGPCREVMIVHGSVTE